MRTESAIPVMSANETPLMKKEGVIIALLCFTVTLVVMNTTMFNVALPRITDDFDLSTTASSWIVTGYSIVFAIFSITYSRLSDFIPIRMLLAAGLSILVVASVLGFFSHSYWLLLGSRLLQAFGAASAPGLGVVLISRYIPVSRRGKSMAAVMSSASLGFGLGPVIGGSVTEYLGWNYLFLVTGLVILLIPLFYRFLPAGTPKKVQFDLLGAALIGIGTTSVLLFLTTYSFPALGIGAAALILFAVRINRAANPFVQPALFVNQSYMTLSLMGLITYISQFAILFLMPIILVRLFGKTPAETGLIIFPGAILSVVLAGRIGRMIDRYGNKWVLRSGHLLLVAATSLFALLGQFSDYFILAVYMLMGVAITCLITGISNEMSRILPKEMVGAGMGLAQLTQFFGGAFGVAMTGIAMVWQKNAPLGDAFSAIFWGMCALACISSLFAFAYKPSNR